MAPMEMMLVQSKSFTVRNGKGLALEIELGFQVALMGGGSNKEGSVPPEFC